MPRVCLVAIAVAMAAVNLLGQGGPPSGTGNGNPPGNPSGNGNPPDMGKPGDTGKPPDTGKPTDPGQQGAAKAVSITVITPKTEIEQGLSVAGLVAIQFKSSADLENISVWLTPSLDDVKATPDSFAKITKDTAYSILLEVKNKPDHTLGGTLQLRKGEDSGRTYAQPLPISIKVSGGQDSGPAEVKVTGIASSADYKTGSVSAGQIVSIFGSGLGPDKPDTAKTDDKGRVSTVNGSTQVLVNGIPAPILAISNTQVNIVVPKGVATDDRAEFVVTNQDKVSVTVSVPVQSAAPALFSLDGSGHGQAAALNQDGTVNGPSTPIRRGGAVVLFGSGFGDWKENVPDGTLVSSTLPTPKASVSVTIGGVPAKVLYNGGAPGLVSGVVQINAEVPESVTPGEKVTVVVTAGDKSSTASATIAVR